MKVTGGLEHRNQENVGNQSASNSNLRLIPRNKNHVGTLRFRGFRRDEAARFLDGLYSANTKAGENCDQIDSRLKPSTHTCQAKNYKYFAIQVLTPIQRVY